MNFFWFILRILWIAFRWIVSIALLVAAYLATLKMITSPALDAVIPWALWFGEQVGVPFEANALREQGLNTLAVFLLAVFVGMIWLWRAFTAQSVEMNTTLRFVDPTRTADGNPGTLRIRTIMADRALREIFSNPVHRWVLLIYSQFTTVGDPIIWLPKWCAHQIMKKLAGLLVEAHADKYFAQSGGARVAMAEYALFLTREVPDGQEATSAERMAVEQIRLIVVPVHELKAIAGGTLNPDDYGLERPSHRQWRGTLQALARAFQKNPNPFHPWTQFPKVY